MLHHKPDGKYAVRFFYYKKLFFMYENIRAARYSDGFYQASTRKREHILQWYIYFVHFMLSTYKSVYGMCIDSHAAISYSFSKELFSGEWPHNCHPRIKQ